MIRPSRVSRLTYVITQIGQPRSACPSHEFVCLFLLCSRGSIGAGLFMHREWSIIFLITIIDVTQLKQGQTPSLSPFSNAYDDPCCHRIGALV